LAASIERRAAAKVNLALHVVGRRPDAYHELDTVAVFADAGDTVTVSANEALGLEVTGPFGFHAPADGENLVLKAATLLKEAKNVRGGAAIRLKKNLPAGAGFGGGSADAAAALLALNEVWNLSLGLDELARIGGALGADVPMCLVSRALRARGTGERIEPVESWPSLPLVLVWPGVPVATSAVFAALRRRDGRPLPEPWPAETPAVLTRWLQKCRNELEEAALGLAPEIGEALQALRGTGQCLIARMSGSGSGCFGLYTDRAAAEAAAIALRKARPGWWVAATLAR
jgi:4-diphosphocytidyl-2-C-methyl-D-erythritol kinase